MQGIVNLDYVVCPICGKEGQRIYKHINKKHGISIKDFNVLYPNNLTTCINLKRQIKQQTLISLNTPEVIKKRNDFWNSPKGKKTASRNGAKAWENRKWVERRNYIVSIKMTEKWRDPVWSTNQSVKIAKSLHCERVHNLHHERLVKQWKDPEYRKHITEMVSKMVSDGKLGAWKEYIDNLGNIVHFRSSWELEFHNTLNEMCIRKEYEKHKFRYHDTEGKLHIYTPDFYLPDFDLFVEVKPNHFQSYETNLVKINVVLEAGKSIIFIGDNEYNNADRILEKICGYGV